MATMLLAMTFVLFPAYPVFALLTAVGAVYVAKNWRVDWVPLIESIFFTGALVGCLLVWTGVA